MRKRAIREINGPDASNVEIEENKHALRQWFSLYLPMEDIVDSIKFTHEVRFDSFYQSKTGLVLVTTGEVDDQVWAKRKK
jgi:hypothetical protein